MSVVLLGSTSGSVTLQEPAIAGSTVIDLPATSGTMAVLPTATSVLPEASGGTGTTTGYYGFKNRIINGAMVIDQRNAGASVTANNGIYAVDRFLISTNLVGKATEERSTTAPTGFTNSLLITSSAATSLASGDYFSITQKIEGFNCADLNWGATAASAGKTAATVTVSFWVRSSLTGTFGGAINNSSSNRSYPFSYTISAANTWEQKSVTIAGDTSGTWLTDNGVGLQVRFALGMGSTYSGTAGAWVGSDIESVTGAVNVLGTNGATFYITGVQLEKGSTATSFDYRPIGTELALCQRYCFVSSGAVNKRYFTSGNYNGTNAFPTTYFPVSMRTGPSLTVSSTTHFTFETYASVQQTLTSISANVSTTDNATIIISVASALANGGNVIGNNASAQVIFSAEL